MNRRLEQFLAAENISQAQFADKIRVTRASVSHILAGRNKPSYDFLLETMRHYPALNIEWLMNGKGKMYKGRDEVKSIETIPEVELDTSGPKSPQLVDEISTDNGGLLPFPDTLSVDKGSILEQTEKQEVISLKENTTRRIVKVIVMYDDGTFEELG